MNAQDLDNVLSDLFQSGRIEELFTSALNGEVKIYLTSITIQIDRPDAWGKRGLHVDAHHPPVLKLFVYLTPVLSDDDGPYAAIKGSNGDVLRKLRCIAATKLRGLPLTDMPLYSTQDCDTFIGPAGTTILSIQSVVHAGWMPHTTKDRVALICYLDTKGSDLPFGLGRSLIDSGGSP